MESGAHKPSIVLDGKQAGGLEAALKQWSSANLISSQLAKELLSTIEIQENGFDWEKFAKYSFRLAVLCLAVAVASLVFDELFLKLVKKILDLPPPLRSAFTAVVAVAVHIWVFQRSAKMPQQIYFNEAMHGVGAVLFALAALQLGEMIERQFQKKIGSIEKSSAKDDRSPDSQRSSSRREASEHREAIISLIVLLLSVIYGMVGVLAKSNFIWSCGMLTFAAYLGAQTGYFFGTYYLGVESPIKFILAGTSFLCMAYVMPAKAITAPLSRTTVIWGLLYIFIPLWILSIFGLEKPDGGFKLPEVVRSEAFWSVAFLAAGVLSVWHGLYYGLSTTKGFGLTFIGINLYTKFFEMCWEHLYKPLFFTVLALTLALLGHYAEAIWNLRIGDISVAIGKMVFHRKLGVGLLFAGLAHAQSRYADNQVALVKDSEAVAANFPDVEGIPLYSPAFLNPESVPAGFDNGKSGPTDDVTLDYFLRTLSARNAWMTYHNPDFKSEEGRSIPYVILSTSSQPQLNASVAPKLRIWLNGGVHGNEPAGDQGLLALLGKLDANSTWANSLLEVADIMVIPRYNPDGVAYFQRYLATGFDPNRDHAKLARQQTRDIKKLIMDWNPHVGVECHEYSANRGYGGEGQWVSAADGEFSAMKNLNIHQDIRDLSEKVFAKNVATALESHGLRWSPYIVGTPNNAPVVFEELTGEPRYADTSIGISQALVFLTETRGIMLGGQHFQRRVASGLIMLEAILQTVIDRADEVYNTIEDARTKFISSNDDIIITEHTQPMNTSWTFIESASGKIVQVPITFLSTTPTVANITRARPEAYIFPPCWMDVADRLRVLGLTVETLRTPFQGNVEAFNITSSRLASTIWEGAIQNDVGTSVSQKKISLPAGSFWVSTRQQNAALAWLTLEPDALDSFARFNIIPVLEGYEYPVYRVMA
ncbi:Carboxypeptidase 2 [Paramyrothecium foliicola]|nr:Carboxypeptidase 2 [Paramyrothecium foliicola]